MCKCLITTLHLDASVNLLNMSYVHMTISRHTLRRSFSIGVRISPVYKTVMLTMRLWLLFVYFNVCCCHCYNANFMVCNFDCYVILLNILYHISHHTSYIRSSTWFCPAIFTTTAATRQTNLSGNHHVFRGPLKMLNDVYRRVGRYVGHSDG